MLLHQALDAPPTDRFAGSLEHSMHPWTAVGLTAVTMRLPYLGEQTFVFLRPLAHWSITPGVVAAGADSVDTTHPSHGMFFLLLLDEGEDLALRAEVKAIAFFKRSCSSCNCS